jgi:hypothetical protein
VEGIVHVTLYLSVGQSILPYLRSLLSIYLTSLYVLYIGEVASHKSMTIGQVRVCTYIFISLKYVYILYMYTCIFDI